MSGGSGSPRWKTQHLPPDRAGRECSQYQENQPMTILARLDRQSELQAIPAVVLEKKQAARRQATPGAFDPRTGIRDVLRLSCAPPSEQRPDAHLARELASLEQSLRRILDPATTSERLSPLEENILDLMCADRGITGRILKLTFGRSSAISLSRAVPNGSSPMSSRCFANSN